MSGKIVALVLVVALVVIGLAGLVLPIIPGLLFLFIAAVIAAPHFPSLDARLRKLSVGRHLNLAERLRHVGLLGKIQIAGLLCARTLVEALGFVASMVSKLAAARATRS